MCVCVCVHAHLRELLPEVLQPSVVVLPGLQLALQGLDLLPLLGQALLQRQSHVLCLGERLLQLSDLQGFRGTVPVHAGSQELGWEYAVWVRTPHA